MSAIRQKPSLTSLIVLITAAISMLVGFGIALWIGQGYLVNQKKEYADGLAYSQTQSDAIAKKMNDEMADQKTAVDGLADQLSSGKVAYQDVVPALKAVIDKKPNLFGAVVCFAPDVFPGKKLYGPYFSLAQTGQHELIQVEDKYDYSDAAKANSFWYQQIIKAGKGQWIRQYGAATQDWVILYGAPFFHTDAVTGVKTLAGVVAATHSVSTTLKAFMQSLDLGQEGYSLLATDNGTIAYHPNPALINKSILDAAKMMGDVPHGGAAQRQINGENFYIERKSTNQISSWTTFRLLPASKWTLVTVVYQNALNKPSNQKFINFIYLGLALLLGLLGLATLLIRPDKKTYWRLWAISLVGSLLILLCLCWTWYLINTISLEKRNTMVNYENVATALQAASKTGQTTVEAPIQIPTGVLIDNISISNNSATLSGYIWQAFPINMNATSIVAPRFPDAIGNSSLNEVYHFVRNGKQVVGWVFNVELNQQFNFHQYPLDKNNVHILIEPSDYTINTVMVPDFDSYSYMSPAQKPGIKTNLSPIGWEVVGSGFDYAKETYNTTFGSSTQIYKNKYPVLDFTIQIERLVLSPVITYGIIICVLLAQIFGLLIFPVEKPTESFSISAALFLVIAITHSTLRSGLDLNGTVYLEYLLIFMYIVVLIVGLLSLLRTLRINAEFLHHDALPPKLLFWPVIFSMVLAITLLVFYPGT
ncbi:MAG: hypothetical protein WCK35_10475 [Chloroflexota bacterium]